MPIVPNELNKSAPNSLGRSSVIVADQIRVIRVIGAVSGGTLVVGAIDDVDVRMRPWFVHTKRFVTTKCLLHDEYQHGLRCTEVKFFNHEMTSICHK